MNDSKAGAKGVASELKGLTTEPTKAVVRSETARAELAACARMVRWRTAMAQPRQERLGYGSASAEVRRVISRWRQGWWCKELP